VTSTKQRPAHPDIGGGARVCLRGVLMTDEMTGETEPPEDPAQAHVETFRSPARPAAGGAVAVFPGIAGLRAVGTAGFEPTTP
jgi:hypothetical protein